MKPVKLSAVIATACVSAAPFTLSAQTIGDTAQLMARNGVIDKAAAGKIGPQLTALYAEHVSKRKGDETSRIQSADTGTGISIAAVPTHDGMVTIDAIARGDAEALLAELQAMGMENGSTWGRVVSGRMPVGQLDAMNGMSNLVSAAPALNSRNVGLTTSQGDVAQASDVARSLYGLDGSGVTVGSLSDSYD